MSGLENSAEPELVGRHWCTGLLDLGVLGVPAMTSINPPSSWQLAAGPGILPAPTASAGGFTLSAVPSGTPGARCSSSSLLLGDAARGWERRLGGRVSGRRGSPSEDGEPGCLWAQTRPVGLGAPLHSRRRLESSWAGAGPPELPSRVWCAEERAHFGALREARARAAPAAAARAVCASPGSVARGQGRPEEQVRGCSI